MKSEYNKKNIAVVNASAMALRVRLCVLTGKAPGSILAQRKLFSLTEKGNCPDWHNNKQLFRFNELYL